MNAKLMRPATCALALLLLHAQVAHPQTTPTPTPAATPAGAPVAAAPVFKREELDQILAPIALYPDELLAQILMAATYPLEIVQADRWVRTPANAKLKGDQLAAALEKQSWDPSVKSLMPFPQVLRMMSEKLDWTQKLGDAVLAQQPDVMASVQGLRKAAEKAGKLKSTEQQTVKNEDQAIVIQPANPQTVYVPAYNPAVVYGTWPYPSYPPYYYPPAPTYYPGAALATGMAFAAGVAIVGSMWGWGNCNWGGGSIYVNHNQYNNINRSNINAGRATQLPVGSNNWKHDPGHRGGVAYRDPQSRQNFQRSSTLPTNARQNFRGFESGARPGQAAGAVRPSQGAIGAGAAHPSASVGAGAARSSQGGLGAGAGATRPTQSGLGAGAGVGARPATGAATRPAAPAFSGIGNGSSANIQADRGRASRAAMSAPSAGSSHAPLAGGGGFRTGGGRRR